jgi:hypothetical protein
MRLLLVISVGTSLVFLGQDAAAQPQTGNLGQVEQKASTEKPSITLPAGTKVMLAMTTPVWSKTTHAGDAVHAVTALTVTVGTTVAIPAGTYQVAAALASAH